MGPHALRPTAIAGGTDCIQARLKHMRITLVDNLVMPEEHSLELLDVHPHLGLLSLAAVAEREGHVVQIYDPKRLIRAGALSYDETVYDRAAQSLLSQRPDAVGFTALG